MKSEVRDDEEIGVEIRDARIYLHIERGKKMLFNRARNNDRNDMYYRRLGIRILDRQCIIWVMIYTLKLVSSWYKLCTAFFLPSNHSNPGKCLFKSHYFSHCTSYLYSSKSVQIFVWKGNEYIQSSTTPPNPKRYLIPKSTIPRPRRSSSSGQKFNGTRRHRRRRSLATKSTTAVTTQSPHCPCQDSTEESDGES